MLVPTVHHGKDTTHKSLETMCNARAWPHVGRAVQTDPTLLRYASAITEQTKGWKLLAQKFDRFQTLRNNSQQHATTCNRVWEGRKHGTSNNVGNCWTTMLHPFARALHLRLLLQQKKMLRKATVLGLWCACSAVLRAKCACVWRRICRRSLCLPFRLRVCIQWYLDITSLSLNRGSTVLHLRMALPAG